MSKTLLLIAGTVFTCPSVAHELETSVGFDAEYFDNILRIRDDDPSDDLLTTAFVSIDYLYQLTDVEASFEYTAKTFDYRDDTFEDRTDLTGTTTINWQMVPNRLNWNLLHIRDRVLTDRSLVALPSNEQDRKTFSTGPQIQWNFGADTRLQFRGSFIDNRAESSRSFKSTQTRGEWDFSRQIANYTFGLSSQRSNVNVVDSEQDYDQERYSVSLSGGGALATWNINIGHNEVERETEGVNSGLFYSGSLNFIRKDLSVNFSTNRELTDSQLGLSLNNNIDAVDNTGEGGLRDFDIIERTRHSMRLTYDFQRLSLSYSFTRDEQDYQTLLRDESSQNTTVAMKYSPTQTSTITYRYSRTSSTFQSNGAPDNRFRHYNRRLSWRYQANRQLSSELWFTVERRGSDAGQILNFKDETIGVKLTYVI